MLYFLFLCLINKTYRFRRINQTFSSLSSKVMKNQNHDPPFFLPLMVYSPETYRQNSREKHINYLILEQSWNFKYLIKSHANILDVKKKGARLSSLLLSVSPIQRDLHSSLCRAVVLVKETTRRHQKYILLAVTKISRSAITVTAASLGEKSNEKQSTSGIKHQ